MFKISANACCFPLFKMTAPQRLLNPLKLNNDKGKKKIIRKKKFHTKKKIVCNFFSHTNVEKLNDQTYSCLSD